MSSEHDWGDNKVGDDSRDTCSGDIFKSDRCWCGCNLKALDGCGLIWDENGTYCWFWFKEP